MSVISILAMLAMPRGTAYWPLLSNPPFANNLVAERPEYVCSDQTGLRPIPLPGYLPAHLPPILSKLAPRRVEANVASFRGYRSISLDWEVKVPQSELARTLSEGYGLAGFGHTDTGRTWMVKVLPDRTVLISTQPGTLKPIPGNAPKTYRSIDKQTYTWVMIVEYPLPIGPMPKDWPEKARVAVPMPSNAPRVPIPGFDRVPEVVEYSSGEFVRTHYSVTWFVHESKATAYPRWIKALETTGKWVIDHSANGTFCQSKGKKLDVAINFLNIDIDQIPLPKDWCFVSMDWAVKEQGPYPEAS